MTTTPPQATQDEPVSETYRLDEGEREKLIALIGQAHKGKTSAFIADAILAAGYSRRTETAEFLAKYDAGMMAAAEETIAFLKQRAEKAEAELARRTEATGEVGEIATNIVTDYLVAEDRRGVASKLVADVTAAITAHAERAIERCAKLREVAELAASANNELQRMYDGQDNERKTRGAVGSIHRDIFEAYIDTLVEEAEGALQGQSAEIKR